MLDAVNIILSIVGLGKQTYELLISQDLAKKIESAYNNALIAWCPNENIRNSLGYRYFNTQKLIEYINRTKDSDKIDLELISFLKVWEAHLKDDPHTYQFILEIREIESTSILKQLQSSQVESYEKLNSINEYLIKSQSHLIKRLEEMEGMMLSALKNINTKPLFTPIQYNKPIDYVQRSVINYKRSEKSNFSLYLKSSDNKYLIDYLIQEIPEKRIILYSDAQEGKSTELKNLAFETQNSNLFNVHLYEFKYFLGSDFIESHLLNYLSDMTKRNLLILDGLDEVKDDLRQKIINIIEQISASHPDLYIIVSCRQNYEMTNRIDGFRSLYLNSLNYNDVRNYVISKCKESDKLLTEIIDKELYDIIYNPFYLKSIVEYYNDNGNLPQTKAKIYDYVIYKSFKVDQKRDDGGVVSVNEKALPLLLKVAFCLQLTEQSYFNYSQLTEEIGLSTTNIESCCKYTIFKKDTINNYSFTHNAFREYLTATHMAKLDFVNLKDVIVYPSTNILRPNFYNTIVLILGILDEDNSLLTPLISWLSEYKPEILFLCEQHFISSSRCYEIFSGYFKRINNYGEYIYGQWSRKIMYFSNTRETVLFLLNSCKSQTAFNIELSNALSLLQYANFMLLNSKEKDSLDEYFLSLLYDYTENIEQIDAIYTVFNNEYFHNPEKFLKLFVIVKNSENALLLNHFFMSIKSAGLADNYIDWIIDKSYSINNYYTSSGSMISVNKNALIDVLCSVSKIDNVIKALNLFLHYDCQINDNERTKVLTTLLKTLESTSENFTYTNVSSIVNLLKDDNLIILRSPIYVNSIAHLFQNLIFKNGWDNNLFDIYYKELKNIINLSNSNFSDHYNLIIKRLNVLTTIMTNERFDLIIDEFKSTEISINIASWLRTYNIISSNDKWNDIIENILMESEYFNMNQRKIPQSGFDILFDYPKFSNEILDITKKHPYMSFDYEMKKNCLKMAIMNL